VALEVWSGKGPSLEESNLCWIWWSLGRVDNRVALGSEEYQWGMEAILQILMVCMSSSWVRFWTRRLQHLNCSIPMRVRSNTLILMSSGLGMESVASFFELLYDNLPSLTCENWALWIPNKKGMFEVRSCYNALRGSTGFPSLGRAYGWPRSHNVECGFRECLDNWQLRKRHLVDYWLLLYVLKKQGVYWWPAT